MICECSRLGCHSDERCARPATTRYGDAYYCDACAADRAAEDEEHAR
jgi:hypothetical protein